MAIEITVFFHDRPESAFNNVIEAARYLWPDSLTRQMDARDELESFHETANADRYLMAKRTDDDAYKGEDDYHIRNR